MQGKICCVTGHRDIPADKLGYVKAALASEIDRALCDGFTGFISGFADGADLIFAGLVAGKMAERPDIRLIAAIPYRKRLDALRRSEKTAPLIGLCAEIHVAAEEYLPSVYALRNRYMAERSDRVIAVYDGRENGGTAWTVHLARALNKELIEITLPARSCSDAQPGHS